MKRSTVALKGGAAARAARRLLPVVPLLVMALAWPGCRHGDGTQFPKLPVPASAALLREGDGLVVVLQSIPGGPDTIQQKINGGTITLPLIGEIGAAGETESSLAAKVKQTYLQRKLYPQIDVSVTAAQRFVNVGGRVNRPGPVQYREDLTFFGAITEAGGWALYAKKSPVTVIRDGVSHKVNGVSAGQGGYDPPLFPGDKINVDRAFY